MGERGIFLGRFSHVTVSGQADSALTSRFIQSTCSLHIVCAVRRGGLRRRRSKSFPPPSLPPSLHPSIPPRAQPGSTPTVSLCCCVR